MFSGTDSLRKGKMCTMTQKVGSQKCERCKCGQCEPWCTKDCVQLIAEELNMNRETVLQILTEDLEIEIIFLKMMLCIFTTDHELHWLHFSCDLLNNTELFDRVITSDEMYLWSGNKMSEQAVKKNYLSQKNHVLLAVCMFLWS